MTVPSTKRDSLTDTQMKIIGDIMKDFPSRQLDQWKESAAEEPKEPPPPYPEHEAEAEREYWKGWYDGRRKLYRQIQQLLNKG